MRALATTVVAALLATSLAVVSAAQSDLDGLMETVLAKRDASWTKVQQYLLDERETFQLTGPDGRPLFGSRREFLWFPKDGVFIRSPLTADGVAVSEAERARAEAAWIERERRREQRRAERAARDAGQEPTPSDSGGSDANLGLAVREALEPGFVSASYFMTFAFEPDRYAFVGRATHAGREVLQVEYYPTAMFREGRTRPNRRFRERDPDVERKMNRTSIGTLWIDPAQHQIVRYEFVNVDMDFLDIPFAEVDGWRVAMEMSQPFEGVWLPQSIEMSFDLATAVGRVGGRYTTEYGGYRLATVDTRVRP